MWPRPAPGGAAFRECSSSSGKCRKQVPGKSLPKQGARKVCLGVLGELGGPPGVVGMLSANSRIIGQIRTSCEHMPGFRFPDMFQLVRNLCDTVQRSWISLPRIPTTPAGPPTLPTPLGNFPGMFVRSETLTQLCPDCCRSVLRWRAMACKCRGREATASDGRLLRSCSADLKGELQQASVAIFASGTLLVIQREAVRGVANPLLNGVLGRTLQSVRGCGSCPAPMDCKASTVLHHRGSRQCKTAKAGDLGWRRTRPQRSRA